MTKTRPKFLDPREIDEAIAEVAQIALSEGVDVALIGGAAMAAYGSDRLTKDVDFASLAPLAALTTTRSLSFGGYAARTPAGHPVDVVVRSDEYQALYDEAVDASADVGLPVRVVLPEHLAALKMAAAREKDVLDLKTLVRLGVLDLPRTRSIVKKHLGEYAARELDSLVDEVAWEESRERTRR
jgi:predicted nucleotidyltransferase